MTWKRIFEFKSPEFAKAKQEELSSEVDEKTPAGFEPRFVCGLDAAYEGRYGVGVASVWDLQACNVTESKHVVLNAAVEYRPGFLAFREGPLVVAAAKKLRSKPDVFLADGHGKAHPRGFGLACHVGLALDSPTVGVAKSRLYGLVRDAEVVDKDGVVVGRVLKPGRRGFYVSVGHKIGLDDALRVVERSLVNDVPAPLRNAHLEAARLRRELPS